jgi:DNA-binding response OmpR family regulator
MIPSREIIVVEDEPADYERIRSALTQESVRFNTRLVDAPDVLEEELMRLAPDAVLCDHSSDRWDSYAVLKRVRACHHGMPFVVVSGGLDEATQTGLLERGVDACVFKNRLGELGPAVRYALRLGEERRWRRAAESERDILREQLSALQARTRPQPPVPICPECKHVRNRNRSWRKLEDHFRDEFALRFSQCLCPTCTKHYYTEPR